ncbi:DinB family protein [Ornithinimicrobium murale]|uniref:DinB family protein n=1 Tax=Ornithinimicrobium murale TaxID=1050153 RepID=UPI000E0D71E5|nr:DinB family protein [Ornithinimicrobium murale]
MSEDPIVPDTKDWTWTTRRRCSECGFDASSVGAADLAELLPALAAPWKDVLAGADVEQRPEPATWSPLEYAGHVHEVLDLFAQRFELVLAQDDPTLPNWDQDVAAVEGDYASQDPEAIAREIPERSAALVAVLARYGNGRRAAHVPGLDRAAGEAPDTSGDPWGRTTRRSDGAEFTALSLGRYLVHDLAHHLHDVGLGHRIPSTGSSRA